MPGIRLSSDLCDELSNAAKSIVKRKGTLLFRAGQPGKGAFVIRNGRVRMSLGNNPHLYSSRTLGPGIVIGLPATFSGEPYSLTAEAESDCHLDFIPRAKLLNLLRSNPTVGFQIVRVLSEEIFQMRKGAVALKTPRRGHRKIKVASRARR